MSQNDFGNFIFGIRTLKAYEAMLNQYVNYYYMTKNKFRVLCAQAGVTCRYSGKDQTMYIHGNKDAAFKVKEAATGANFKIII